MYLPSLLGVKLGVVFLPCLLRTMILKGWW